MTINPELTEIVGEIACLGRPLPAQLEGLRHVDRLVAEANRVHQCSLGARPPRDNRRIHRVIVVGVSYEHGVGLGERQVSQRVVDPLLVRGDPAEEDLAESRPTHETVAYHERRAVIEHDRGGAK